MRKFVLSLLIGLLILIPKSYADYGGCGFGDCGSTSSQIIVSDGTNSTTISPTGITFSGSTIANLGTVVKGTIKLVTDAVDSSDCSIGGGSVFNVCIANMTGWQDDSPLFPHRANTISLAGDSLTERCATPLLVASNGVAWGSSETGANRSVIADCMFTMLNTMTGYPFTVISAAGISGNTSTQLLARYQTDVLAYKAGTVWIMIGTNDVPTSGNVGLATSKSNILSMVNQSTAAGQFILLSTIYPRDGTAGALLTAGNRRYYADLNQWIKNNFINYPNVLVIDSNKFTSDYLAVTGIHGFGGWKANYAADATHPNLMEAIFNAALAGLPDIQRLFTPYRLLSNMRDTYDGAGSPTFGTLNEGQNIFTAAQSFNYNTGGSVTPASGTIVGTPPVGMNLQLSGGTGSNGAGLTVTITEEANPDGISNDLVLTNVVSANTGQQVNYGVSLSTGKFTTGKYYEFSGQITLSQGPTLVSTITAWIYDFSGQTSNNVSYSGGGNSAGTGWPQPTTITFKTPRFRATNPLENPNCTVTYKTIAAGTSVVRISKLAVREYSTFYDQ